MKNFPTKDIQNYSVKIGMSFFGVLLVTLIAVLITGRILVRQTLEHYRYDLSKTMANVLQISVNQVSFTGKYHSQLLVDKILEREENLLYIYVISENGQVIAKSQRSIEGFAGPKNYKSYFFSLNRDSFTQRDTVCCDGNEKMQEISELIMPYDSSFDQSKRGLIIAGLSSVKLNKDLQRNTMALAVFGVLASIIGFVLVFWIAGHISRPINSLAQTFKSFLWHAPMAIIIRDRDGTIVETSDEYNKYLGLQGDQTHLKTNYQTQWAQAFFEVDESLKSGLPFLKKDIKLTNGSKDEFFTLYSFPIEDNINYSDKLFCSIALNINDEISFKHALEKRTQEAKRASDAKTNFLATMSHEIRTPLTSIIGFLGLLWETEQDESQKKYTKTALGSSESLLALINDILDYSKIESKDFDLESTDFSITSLLDDVSKIFEFQIAEKKLTLQTNIDSRLHTSIVGDPTRLRQIIINLIGNSIKFTSIGGITINVDLIKDLGESQQIRVSVEDTGIGIKANQLSLIFEQFSQADNSITRKYGGTGLGLSITKKLIEMMKGEIKAESQYGQGSKFFFELKLPKSYKVFNDRAQESENKELSYIGKKVLVADDEESNRQLISLYLAKVGLIPDFATNGQEAVDRAISQSYDLILLDIQMPELDGVQALKKIRENESQQGKKQTPTYAFTANVFKEQLDEYHDHGFNGHLTKPFKKNELLEFLRNNLS